ncbi:heterokaryon incompatibility protein-domain-containing protein [Apodospora peruviana]|uniref:Heterokaryon incompatibility protein-domain-containing protein n=1 Tax=Apodospora peruviana TaxID=516989 RepID=A0AAE0IHQ7_9PEZI|nr:heterokaryon incompatibility protein-domain-containing protein [Apodospora peruviana]
MENPGPPDQKLCARCQTIDIAKYFQEKNPGTVELGLYQDVLTKSEAGCPLCKLVIQALGVYAANAGRTWKVGEFPTTQICHLGRLINSKLPVLEVWFSNKTETMPKLHSGLATYVGRIQCLNLSETIDSVGTASKRRMPARLLDERLDYSLVKSWMQDCAENHGPNCNPPPSTLDRESGSLVLVDVKRMRLVRSRWDSRYLALSYVWGHAGDGSQFQAVGSNFDELQQDDALSQVRNKLPTIISDAIDFVLGIGKTYLWVDALCIVQDDPDSKAEYIPRMGQIYGQALLTIIGLAGHGGSSSLLPGVNANASRIPSWRRTPVQLGALSPVAELLNLQRCRQSSKWNRRAWTLQEEILSKRRLYFSDHQVYWQCATIYRAEGGFETLTSDGGKIAQGAASPLDRDDYVRTPDNSRWQFWLQPYWTLAMQYSRRVMTYPSDSLNAFAGILGSALPEHAFDYVLLWEPQLHVCRSPTWCWTAWDGSIYWDGWKHNSFAGKMVRIKSEVDGDYFIKEKGSFRKIARQTSPNHDDDDDDNTQGNNSNSTQSVRLGLARTLEMSPPAGPLFFEAACQRASSYTISCPPNEEISHRRRNDDLWMYDSAGHHCGTMMAISWWKQPTDDDDDAAGAAYDLVALSRGDQDQVTQADVDAHHDELSSELHSAEAYYERIFDAKSYKYKRCWAVNVLLVEWKGAFARRVGVGQMHADAWDAGTHEMKGIILV